MSNVLVGATVVVIAGFAGAFLYQQYQMEHEGEAERIARTAELSQQRVIADEVAKLTRAATTTPAIASLDAAKRAHQDPTGEIAKIAAMTPPVEGVAPELASPEQVAVSSLVFMARGDYESVWELLAPEFQREFEVSIRRTAMDPTVPEQARREIARRIGGKSGRDLFVTMFRESGEISVQPGASADLASMSSVIDGDIARVTGPGPDGKPETTTLRRGPGGWKIDLREQTQYTAYSVSTAPN